MCFLNGKIEIPLLSSPPDEIKSLLEQNDEKSQFFKNNIRGFNSALEMTSLEDNQQNLPKGGPSIFKIQGNINHRIGSLLPSKQNDVPQFAQIYIYDTEHEIENRLKVLNDLNTESGRNILEILKENNPHVKNLRVHMNV